MRRTSLRIGGCCVVFRSFVVIVVIVIVVGVSSARACVDRFDFDFLFFVTFVVRSLHVEVVPPPLPLSPPFFRLSDTGLFLEVINQTKSKYN